MAKPNKTSNGEKSTMEQTTTPDTAAVKTKDNKRFAQAMAKFNDKDGNKGVQNVEKSRLHSPSTTSAKRKLLLLSALWPTPKKACLRRFRASSKPAVLAPSCGTGRSFTLWVAVNTCFCVAKATRKHCPSTDGSQPQTRNAS